MWTNCATHLPSRRGNEGKNTRDFRAERISQIVVGMTPVKLTSRSRALAVLHVMPLGAFESERRLDARQLMQAVRELTPTSRGLQPIYSSRAYTNRYNFEGFLIDDSAEGAEREAFSYLQLFRTGILEAVSAEIFYTDKLIPSARFEGQLLQQECSKLSECFAEARRSSSHLSWIESPWCFRLCDGDT